MERPLGTTMRHMRVLRRDPLHKLPGCWYIHDSRMLQGLDEQTVAQMMRRSTVSTFERGEFLHHAGEPMDTVSFISEGRVKVYRVSAEGKQQTIVRLGPGDAFGEIGIVDPRGQDLYVEALEHTAICRTTREAFLRLCSRDPELAVHLAEAIGEKLQEAREQVADLAFRDVSGRVAHLLLTLLDRERRLAADDGIDRILPGLTHREIAEIIGTRRESVTSALNAFERDGLIAIEDREYVIVDVEALRDMAEV